MSCIYHVAQAIQAVREFREAQKRIPDSLKTHSFFGALDFWRYVPVFDDRLCPICRGHWSTYFFKGDELRSTFPYLEIEDEDTIKVATHPRCRCFAWRVTIGDQYDLVYRFFYGEPPKQPSPAPVSKEPPELTFPFILFGDDDVPFGKYVNMGACIVDLKKELKVSTGEAAKKCLALRRKTLSWI